MTHISGFERSQLLLLPEAIDDYVVADALCDAAIGVQVGRSGQYRASRHLRAAAIIASTPRMLSARRKL